MKCFRVCLGCSLIPLSGLVLLVALLVPHLQLSPPGACQPDANGTCKHSEGLGSVRCSDGVLLRLTKQPRIGLRHLAAEDFGGEGVAFAALTTSAGCSVRFSLTCGEAGDVRISESWTCAGAAKQAPAPAILGDLWEVCAEGADLTLLLPVIDLVFDVETENRAVDGCVAVSAPSSLPRLASVRGPLLEQTEELVARKREVGGCPTWINEADRLARSWDYKSVFGWPAVFAVQHQLKFSKEVALDWKAGNRQSEGGPRLLFTMVSMMAAAGGEPGAMHITSTVNCGSPTFALLPTPALMVTRHAEAAALVGDPQQRRGTIIGAGYSEVCFDKTLPVFLSAGSPEHTQVRKLWDASGLATMHEGELPDLMIPEKSTFNKAKAALLSAALGVDHPLLDDIAPIVASVFLEKLWGKRPTKEEVDAIGAYGTVGGACIVGHLASKLPIWPGKVKAVRRAALDFARSSPVGKKMLQEIEKSEYRELKTLYASTPMGVENATLQNLADASLFAGLIGTSTLSMNCLLQVSKGPQYVKMFRENATAFLLEVARTATPVGGSQQKLRTPDKVTVAEVEIALPENTLISALTGLTAGLDASVFKDPLKFDSRRPNLGEGQNWNGLNKHVFAQDYSGAPRFCPGAGLSVRIAAKVCHHFSSHMKGD